MYILPLSFTVMDVHSNAVSDVTIDNPAHVDTEFLIQNDSHNYIQILAQLMGTPCIGVCYIHNTTWAYL
jgi:hypothetical protein